MSYSNNVSEIDNLRALNKALSKRVEFLEWRLEQREKATKKDFERLKTFFDAQRIKILGIFMEDIPVTQGLTHTEIQQIYGQKYPRSNVTYLPRRVCELVEANKLWRYDDPDGTARFYLTLKPDEEF